jgi:hypothetical protein
MIDVAQDKTLASGTTIRAALRFRWDAEFDATTVDFHRTTFGGAAYGNRIVLRGRKQQRVLGEGDPYTLVEVEGTVPETVRPGTYVCKYVRCLVPERGWVVLFEDIHDVTLRVRREPYVPPLSKEGAQFLGLEI